MNRTIIWRRLRRHAMLPVAVIAVLLIGYIAGHVYTSKNNGTWDITDLYGDRTALEDAVIYGELADGYHETHFRITANGVSADTKLYEQPNHPYQYSPLFSKVINDKIYEVHGYGYETNMIRASVDRTYRRTGSVTIRHQSMKESSNHSEYGLANVGDDVFYVLPSTLNYKGTNGIYKLDFDAPEPTADMLVKLEMSGNDPASVRGIEVLGLEAVGDILALIFTADNQRLVVRGYDSRTGKLLGEAAADRFAIIGHSRQTGEPRADRHLPSYRSFVDHDGMMLNLSFHRNDDSALPNHPSLSIFSFDLSDGVRLADEVRKNIEDGEADLNRDLMVMNHIEGKLIAVLTVKQPSDEDARFHTIVRPSRFIIYVFEEGELLYKGELVTDWNDDLIRAINERQSYGYSESEHRNFKNVGIAQPNFQYGYKGRVSDD